MPLLVSSSVFALCCVSEVVCSFATTNAAPTPCLPPGISRRPHSNTPWGRKTLLHPVITMLAPTLSHAAAHGGLQEAQLGELRLCR